MTAARNLTGALALVQDSRSHALLPAGRLAVHEIVATACRQVAALHSILL